MCSLHDDTETPSPAAQGAVERKLLERWLKFADSGHWRDGTGLSIATTNIADDTRAALAAQPGFVSVPSREALIKAIYCATASGKWKDAEDAADAVLSLLAARPAGPKGA